MPEKYFSSLIEANQNVGLDVLTLSKFEFEVELLAFRYWSSKFEVKVDGGLAVVFSLRFKT